MQSHPEAVSNDLGAFFGLTLILTLPAYALVAMSSLGVLLSPDHGYAFVPLATLAPLAAAALLRFRAEGWAGARGLLFRTFDLGRLPGRRACAAIVLVPPGLMATSIALALVLGKSLLPANFPLLAAPIVFLGLFGGALSEELGWMGFAFERLNDRWSLLLRSIALGAFIALWHLPLYAFLIADPALLAAQALFPLALRLLIVWFYANIGASLFAATVFHTLFNVCYAVLPVNLAVATALCLATGLALHGIRRPALPPASTRTRRP